MCVHVLDGLTCLAGISDSLCDASIPAVLVEEFYIEPRLAVTWLGGQTHPLIPKVNSDTRPVIWLLRQLIAIEYCLYPGMPMHDTVFAAMLLVRGTHAAGAVPAQYRAAAARRAAYGHVQGALHETVPGTVCVDNGRHGREIGAY